jgi:hypothetical protein
MEGKIDSKKLLTNMLFGTPSIDEHSGWNYGRNLINADLSRNTYTFHGENLYTPITRLCNYLLDNGICKLKTEYTRNDNLGDAIVRKLEENRGELIQKYWGPHTAKVINKLYLQFFWVYKKHWDDLFEEVLLPCFDAHLEII